MDRPPAGDLRRQLELYVDEINSQRSVLRGLSFLQSSREGDYLLAVNGARDLQVDPGQNLPAIAAALVLAAGAALLLAAVAIAEARWRSRPPSRKGGGDHGDGGEDGDGEPSGSVTPPASA